MRVTSPTRSTSSRNRQSAAAAATLVGVQVLHLQRDGRRTRPRPRWPPRSRRRRPGRCARRPGQDAGRGGPARRATATSVSPRVIIPGRSQGDALVQRRGQRADLVRCEQPHLPGGGRCRAQRPPAAPHPDATARGWRRRSRTGRRCRASVACRAASTSPRARDVVELRPHQRGEQAPAGVVGAHPDLGDGRRVEHRAAGHRHPARERRRRARRARRPRARPERAVRLVGRRGPRPPVVVERRAAAARRRTGRGRARSSPPPSVRGSWLRWACRPRSRPRWT